MYDIHALKLRLLKDYSIASRKFTESFRSGFTAFEPQWPNVSLNYGPLTLMQGWVKADSEKILEEIIGLANNFLELEPLIDQTLTEFKI